MKTLLSLTTAMLLVISSSSFAGTVQEDTKKAIEDGVAHVILSPEGVVSSFVQVDFNSNSAEMAPKSRNDLATVMDILKRDPHKYTLHAIAYYKQGEENTTRNLSLSRLDQVFSYINAQGLSHTKHEYTSDIKQMNAKAIAAKRIMSNRIEFIITSVNQPPAGTFPSLRG